MNQKQNNTEVKTVTQKCLRKLHSLPARNVRDRNSKGDRVRAAIITTPLFLPTLTPRKA